MMEPSNTNLSIGRQLLFATIAGSSLITIANYEVNRNTLPSLTVEYSKMNIGYPWESTFGSQISSDYNSVQFEAILSFAQKVIGNSHDIDIDIQDAVNKIFWDLL